jgi:hypothetical protein
VIFGESNRTHVRGRRRQGIKCMERNLTDIHSARTYRCPYIAISRWSRQTPQGDTRGPVRCHNDQRDRCYLIVPGNHLMEHRSTPATSFIAKRNWSYGRSETFHAKGERVDGINRGWSTHSLSASNLHTINKNGKHYFRRNCDRRQSCRDSHHHGTLGRREKRLSSEDRKSCKTH